MKYLVFLKVLSTDIIPKFSITIFCLNSLDDYDPIQGMHDSMLRYEGKEGKTFFNTKMISRFHLKYFNLEVFLNRQNIRSKRDFLFGHTDNGGRYTMNYNGDVDKNIKKYNDMLETAVPYSDYFKNKIFNGIEYIGEYD